MLRRSLFQASSPARRLPADKRRDGGVAAHGVAFVEVGQRRFGQCQATRFDHAAIMRVAVKIHDSIRAKPAVPLATALDRARPDRLTFRHRPSGN